MFFTIINSDRTPLEGRGYKLADESKRFTDYELYEIIVKEKGEEYAQNLTQRFYEGMEPICMGEDGVFYTVLFDNFGIEGEKPMPKGVIWQEISLLGMK